MNSPDPDLTPPEKTRPGPSRIPPGFRSQGERLARLLEETLRPARRIEERCERLEGWADRLAGDRVSDVASRRRLASLLGDGERPGSPGDPAWTSESLSAWLGELVGAYPIILAGCRIESSASPGEVRLRVGGEDRQLAIVWTGDRAPDVSPLSERRDSMERGSVAGTRFTFAWLRGDPDRIPRVDGVQLEGECIAPWD